jgi:hypothetical protein
VIGFPNADPSICVGWIVHVSPTGMTKKQLPVAASGPTLAMDPPHVPPACGSSAAVTSANMLSGPVIRITAWCCP